MRWLDGIINLMGMSLSQLQALQRWSLVSVCLFSRAVGREERCRQISLACVWSTRSVPTTLGLPHTGFAPTLGLLALTARVLHCSGSKLLYRERALSCVRF